MSASQAAASGSGIRAGSIALISAGLIAPPTWWFVWKMRNDSAFHKDWENRMPILKDNQLFALSNTNSDVNSVSNIPSSSRVSGDVSSTKNIEKSKLDTKAKEVGSTSDKKKEDSKESKVIEDSSKVVWEKIKNEIDEIEKRLENAAAKSKESVSTAAIKAEKSFEASFPNISSTPPLQIPKETQPIAISPSTPQHVTLDQVPSRVNLNALRAASAEILQSTTSRSREDIDGIEKQLNRDLEKVLAQDLSTLDESGVRERLVQLVLELKDRNKWEALRLHEVTKLTTQEVATKYEDLLRRQAHVYESIISEEVAKATETALEKATTQADAHVNRILGEKDRSYQQILKKRLEEQTQQLRSEFEKHLQEFVSSVENQNSEEQSKRSEILKDLQKRLTNFESLFKDQARIIAQANQAHELSSATIDFMDTAQTGQPLEKVAANLKKASRGDPLVNAALANLSQKSLKEGSEPLLSLVRRFDVVKSECRRLSLVPEGGGIVSLAMSNVTSRLLIPGNDENDGSVEGILAKANRSLLNGDLAGAVENMEKLPSGLVADAASDWLRSAKDLVNTNTVIKVALTQAFMKGSNTP